MEQRSRANVLAALAALQLALAALRSMDLLPPPAPEPGREARGTSSWVLHTGRLELLPAGVWQRTGLKKVPRWEPSIMQQPYIIIP